MMQQQTVVVQQPAANNQGLLVGTVHGHRDWTSGLFGCCSDIFGVMKACFCMGCLIASLNQRAGECTCVHWVVPGAFISLRTRVRTLGGIRGSMCNDCMAMSLCFTCAMCQLEREMDAMGL